MTTPMQINGFERNPRDPLAREKHVVVASPNGHDFFVMGKPTDEPIEFLKLAVEGQHALYGPNNEVRILDQSNNEVVRFEPYRVPPDEGEPTPERIAMRNRWLEAVLRFLLPPKLYRLKDRPAQQPHIAAWFKKHAIEVQIRPDGGAVRIFRDGQVLSQWGC